MCDACAIQNTFAAVHVAALRRIYYVLRKSDQANECKQSSMCVNVK